MQSRGNASEFNLSEWSLGNIKLRECSLYLVIILQENIDTIETPIYKDIIGENFLALMMV